MKYLPLLLLFCVACTDTQKTKHLTKKWQLAFDRQTCIALMPKSERAIFNGQSAPQQEVILSQLKKDFERNNYLAFRADETFEQVLSEGENRYKGKWKLKNNGALLQLQWKKNEQSTEVFQENMAVMSLEANKLVLGLADKKQQLMFSPYQVKK